jgi:hypothetical protein
MGVDKETELAQKIYANHKELFEFILDKKPDLTLDVQSILMEVVAEQGFLIGSENKFYVRFISREAQPLIYYNKKVKNGWKKRECFQHELVIDVKNNGITYKPVISPSDPEYDSHRLLGILKSIKGFREPYGKKWLVPFYKKDKVDFSEFDSLTRDEQKELLTKQFNKFRTYIDKVEEKLLEHRQELLDMKNV